MNALLDCLHLPSPIQKVNHPFLQEHGIELCVKREDLIHPQVSGNKWRKLKYNLKYALDTHKTTIVTFGGAFSNHIYATAAACKALNIRSIGFIRGEYDATNPTLQFANSCGMEFVFLDRQEYRLKKESPTVQDFLLTSKKSYLIPEGGTNELAFSGLEELSFEINETPFDVVMVSAGTGGTASGILQSLKPNKSLWVFSSMKNDSLREKIALHDRKTKPQRMHFFNQFHYGGYGKTPLELIQFINNFYIETSIPIDPIYNGKLLSGFFELISQRKINPGLSYLWIHTGGLQGIQAYNYMAAKKNKTPIIVP